MQAPFFRALHALAVDDAGRRTGLALDPLTALHTERAMNAIEHAMVGPKIEVIIQCAILWQVLGHVAPLAARAEDVEQATYDLAHIDRVFASAALRGRDQLRDQRPLFLRQVTWIAQLIAVVSGTVFRGPHHRWPLQMSGPT